jgi:hypothetical protein
VLERAAALGKLLAADKEAAKRRAACLAFLSPLLRLHSCAKVLRADPSKGGLQALVRQIGAVDELAEGLLERFYSSACVAGPARRRPAAPISAVWMLLQWQCCAGAAAPVGDVLQP